MAVLISVAVLLQILLLSYAEREGRIVGGTVTSTLNHLHQVYLESDGSHFCGGSIIDAYWVITAAHCIVNENTTSFVVIVNRDDTNDTHTVQSIAMHPSYINGDSSIGYIPHDIALLEMSTAIQSASEYKVDLPFQDDVFVGENCTITGWGLTENMTDTSDLMETHGIILNDQGCTSYYESSYYNHTHNISIHNVDSGACRNHYALDTANNPETCLYMSLTNNTPSTAGCNLIGGSG